MFILDCTEFDQMCYNVKPILEVFKYLIIVIQWSVPILLIILGTIDMFKAVTKANDDKVVQEARNTLIKRIIYGVVIFLVPFFVRLILNFIDTNFISTDDYTSPVSWISCWNDVMNDKSFKDCEDIYKQTADDAQTDTGSDSGTGSSESSENSCSDYTCPTGAKLLGADISVKKVYYKYDCYCRASIVSSSIERESTCNNIYFGQGETLLFAFSESNNNTTSDYCYFKAKKNGSSTGGGQSGSGNCTKECKRKNLVLGRDTEVTPSNDFCYFSAVLDIDTGETSCDSACKNTWGKTEYINSEYKDEHCVCKYNTTCK